jgi:hypothetical protein
MGYRRRFWNPLKLLTVGRSSLLGLATPSVGSLPQRRILFLLIDPKIRVELAATKILGPKGIHGRGIDAARFVASRKGNYERENNKNAFLHG